MVLLRFGTCSKFGFSVGKASPCSSALDRASHIEYSTHLFEALMNADYGAKPNTHPKPVLESTYGPPMPWNL